MADGRAPVTDPLHSVVVPVYNEIESITSFHERCSAAMSAIGERFEIIYVDDGSSDGSWTALKQLARSDDHVRLVRLSRNFGHQLAITAGMEHAAGDTVAVIDADLQDPPEVIAELIDQWRKGADIVYAVRTERRGESWFKKSSASVFYRVISALSDVDLPLDVGDFRLMSRRANEALCEMPENHRYVRGMVAWLGFETAKVGYARDPRLAGDTKYPIGKMFRFATDGILAFSTRPLRIATWLGLIVSITAFLAAISLSVARVMGNYAVQGWTSVMVLVLLLAGVQLLTIGALGEYVGRIYTEVRHRPLYLVREVQGFPAGRLPTEESD